MFISRKVIQHSKMVSQVVDCVSFPKEEVKILQYWADNDTFKKSIAQSKAAKRPAYTFYDGPPFATGLPHHGHLLAGTVKDIVTRYAHQNGFHVERRFGWDCHGLPVEYEIDKKLGITGPADVAKMGIKKYNEECRSIVMRYSKEWEISIGRLGRWIDFENDYKTLYPWFMESVWWVWSQLYSKGLVYKGYKVMPFSTACTTPVSNFEANQNYMDVTDPAVIVTFPIDQDPGVCMVAWTTTPWTLPSNLALCVHPDMEYVKILDKSKSIKLILMEARLCSLYKDEDEYDILDRYKGSALVGKTYTPLFPYMASLKASGAFKVVSDTYVTSDSGTGVVHQSPAFGEDDYRIGLVNGIFKKGQEPFICPVDSSGMFLPLVSDFAGQYVKDADKGIIKMLKADGRMLHASTINHNYPFCWRSDTPLIYKVVPGWFIKVTAFKDKLLSNNDKCYWVPNFVKEKRFKNWLSDARDWSVSRNRYWGTPIPLWISDDGEEILCVGSIKELSELTGQEITDIHRESIDHLTIPSKQGKGQLKRTSEVFDCWFESGSMPYAQEHYPFEKESSSFESHFPADFIAEGVDQTRGWFYTLLVLSTALFDKPPFKNLIVTGLVQAADGKKMSKRLKNYPDPRYILDAYGADALRVYLINSPVVKADALKFKELGVKGVVKDVLLPWFNAYRFLCQNVIRLAKEENVTYHYNESDTILSDNVMDRWILSYTHSLIKFIKEEMALYHLYTVVPRLMLFIENLTNWYVRLNRNRLRGEQDLAECQDSINTLFTVLLTLNRLMAPFTPFIVEQMYQNMKKSIKQGTFEGDSESIHYLMLPTFNGKYIDADIERQVSTMQSVIETGRVLRDRNTLPLKYPLKEVVVVDTDQTVLSDVTSLKDYIISELNIRTLTVSQDKQKYNVSLSAKPNHQILGARLKKDFKPVSQAIAKLTDAQITSIQSGKPIELLGYNITASDLYFSYEVQSNTKSYSAASMNGILVLLDCTTDQEMLDEGLAREVVNRIQKLRKKAHLVPTDRIIVTYNFEQDSSKNSDMKRVIDVHKSLIETSIKSTFNPGAAGENMIICEEVEIKDCKFTLTLCGNVSKLPICQWPSGRPIGEFISLKYGSETRDVLLVANKERLTLDRLQLEIKSMFQLFGQNVKMSCGGVPVKAKNLSQFNGKQIDVWV